MSAIKSSVWKGAVVGGVVATGFGVWVTLLRLTGGSVRFDALGVSWSQVILLYYASLPFGGAVVGLLLPLNRWMLGCATLGFLAFLPLYLAVAFVTSKGPLRAEDILLAVAIACLVGGGGGIWVWWDEIRQRDKRPE